MRSNTKMNKEPLTDLTQLVGFWKLWQWNCKTKTSFSGQNVLVCGELHSFLTTALGGMEWSALHSGLLSADIRTQGTLWLTAEHVCMLRGNKFWQLPGIDKIILDQPACSLVFVKWSVVMWGDLTWFMWSDFILNWSEVKWITVNSLWVQVLCTLWWPYTEGPWFYCNYFIWVYLVLCLF
jgi:hypothetical protein